MNVNKLNCRTNLFKVRDDHNTASPDGANINSGLLNYKIAGERVCKVGGVVSGAVVSSDLDSAADE